MGTASGDRVWGPRLGSAPGERRARLGAAPGDRAWGPRLGTAPGDRAWGPRLGQRQGISQCLPHTRLAHRTLHRSVELWGCARKPRPGAAPRGPALVAFLSTNRIPRSAYRRPHQARGGEWGSYIRHQSLWSCTSFPIFRFVPALFWLL